MENRNLALILSLILVFPSLPGVFGCDTWVALQDATVRDHVLFGKNSDRTIFDCQPLALYPRRSWLEGAVIDLGRISVPQVRETFATLGSGPYWCWGYEEGINEFGVVIGNEGVSTKPLQETIAAVKEGQGPKLGPTGMDLVRLGLERSRTAREAVETIASLTEKHGQFGSGLPGMGLEGAYDNSYLITDANEAWILETAGTRWAARKVEEEVASISNALSLSGSLTLASSDIFSFAREKGWWPGDAESDFDFSKAYSAEGSDQRFARERALVRAQCSLGLLKEKIGVVDESWMKRTARDRSTTPSLDLDVTASSCVVSLPAAAGDLPVFWWCASVPSSGIYIPFFVHGTELPTILTKAGTAGNVVVPPESAPIDQYAANSYWWIFRDLADLVNADRPARLASVRMEFDALEQAFATELPEVLKAASDLRRAGKGGEAAKTLDAFTARCVDQALSKTANLRALWIAQSPETKIPVAEVGTYIANFGAFKDADWMISARDGRLFLEIPGQGALELRPPDEKGFHALVVSPLAGVLFLRHPNHGIVAMTFRQGTKSFELPKKDLSLPPEIPLDKLQKYLGKYYSKEMKEIMEIVIKNNALALVIPGQKSYELRPPDEQGRWFFRVVGTIHLSFHESADGSVGSFTYHEGVAALVFIKN